MLHVLLAGASIALLIFHNLLLLMCIKEIMFGCVIFLITGILCSAYIITTRCEIGALSKTFVCVMQCR